MYERNITTIHKLNFVHLESRLHLQKKTKNAVHELTVVEYEAMVHFHLILLIGNTETQYVSTSCTVTLLLELSSN